MARFVLLHGAWFGAWCFRELIEELEARGHEAVAVDLPGDEPGLTAHDYAALVGREEGAVVVGHSLGAQTAALVPARRHVYLGGVLPVAARHSEAFAAGFGGFVRDERGCSYWPDADTCAARLLPDCTRARSHEVFPRLRRQAPLEPVRAPFAAGDVVVATTRDAAVDPAWQVRTARAHGVRVVRLSSGHSPFFTQPDELAGVLDALA